MKANAIVRIVLYSLVILVLTGLLLAGLGVGQFAFFIGSDRGTAVEKEASVSAEQIRNLEIDWAAGTIRIVSSNTDEIYFQETASGQAKPMTYQVSGDTLKLSYGETGFHLGFGGSVKKDLYITLPENLSLDSLNIDGAALSVEIILMSELGSLDLDGAANTLTYQGSLESIDVDGASNQLTVRCQNRLNEINMDGASCRLDLTLPKSCGFTATVSGLSCGFHSSLSYIGNNNTYKYGDGHCKIDADGISCDITVNEE